MTGATFELGINYWPSRSAMYMWRGLDLVEVRDEMMHVAHMGFDTVRFLALTQDVLAFAWALTAVQWIAALA